MKQRLFCSFMTLCLFTLLACPAFAGDLEKMAGNWSLTRTNENGQVYTQSLEIKKDKFTFRVITSDKNTVLYAKGAVKLEKCGDLRSATFYDIEGGKSQDDLNPSDDDRHCVYVLDGNTLTIGLNFDKDRENGPRIEVYTRSGK